MKIAVIADPHANFIALQAVSEHISSWRPDHVIVAGDLVNRGPRPAECLDFVLDRQQHAGWRLVRGNHEDYVIDQAVPQVGSVGPTSEVHRPSYWTYQQLGYEISALQAMPFQQRSTIRPARRALRPLRWPATGMGLSQLLIEIKKTQAKIQALPGHPWWSVSVTRTAHS
jgi:Icc-related predicted phosphoesterase